MLVALMANADESLTYSGPIGAVALWWSPKERINPT